MTCYLLFFLCTLSFTFNFSSTHAPKSDHVFLISTFLGSVPLLRMIFFFFYCFQNSLLLWSACLSACLLANAGLLVKIFYLKVIENFIDRTAGARSWRRWAVGQKEKGLQDKRPVSQAGSKRRKPGSVWW